MSFIMDMAYRVFIIVYDFKVYLGLPKVGHGTQVLDSTEQREEIPIMQ